MRRAPHYPWYFDSRRWFVKDRIVAQNHLGRELAPGEVVHHVNGDRTDDRPENLEVMTLAAHSRLHGGWTDSARARRVRPPTPELVCSLCEITFRRSPSAVKKPKQGHNFCSAQCKWAAVRTGLISVGRKVAA